MTLVFNPADHQSSKARLAIPRFIINITWFCCVLMAFDFRGQQAGGWFQITSFLVVIVLSGTIGLLLSQYESYYSGMRLQLVLRFLVLFLCSTIFVAYVQNTPLGNYQVVVAPYLLLVFLYWMTSGICRRYGVDMAMQMFFPLLKTLVAFSIIWTLYYGFQGDGVTLESVRYRVISSVLPFGVAYLISAAFSRLMTRWDKLFAVLILMIYIIGQTRSNIIVAIAAFTLVTYAYSANTVNWFKKMISISVWAGVAIVVATLLLNLIGYIIPGANNTDFTEMWGGRIFGSTREFGFDLTTASRLAEYDNQMKKLFSSPVNALLGMGLGAPYTYSGVYADLFSAVLGADAIPENYWNGGHSLWVYTLFANGLIFGGTFLVFILYTVHVSVRLLKSARRIAKKNDRHKIVTLASGYLCILATGFTAYPLGSRPSSFLMGILIALIIGLDQFLSKPNVVINLRMRKYTTFIQKSFLK